MNLYDVNVLVYAHRTDLPQNVRVLPWFEQELNQANVFGISDLVFSSFIRIVTNRKIFVVPTPINIALNEVARIQRLPNYLGVNPGPQHFELFKRLCRQGNVQGNLVANAFLAAIAIEHNCRWISFDRDFGQFQGLDWEEPKI